MVFVKPVLRPARLSGRCSMQRALACWLSCCVLLASTNVLANPKEKAPELPRLGLDAAEPQVRSAPPATPFGIPPATSKEYVLDFHGYLLLPMRLGLNKRNETAGSPGGTVLHAPPLIPQDYRR